MFWLYLCSKQGEKPEAEKTELRKGEDKPGSEKTEGQTSTPEIKVEEPLDTQPESPLTTDIQVWADLWTFLIFILDIQDIKDVLGC